jgi:hypothetical protein
VERFDLSGHADREEESMGSVFDNMIDQRLNTVLLDCGPGQQYGI